MASVSSPTSLASFSYQHAQSSRYPHVPLSPVHGTEGVAVAAVQGDGVWTYDISTVRPITSFTVPPSTIFSTAPISFYPPSRVSSHRRKEKQKAVEGVDIVVDGEDGEGRGVLEEEVRVSRVTAVAVSKSDRVKRDEEGRLIWVWRGDEGEAQSILLDRRIHSLYHVPHHRGSILAVHHNGSFTFLDSNFQLRPVELASSSTTIASVLSAQVLSLNSTVVRVAVLEENGAYHVVELNLAGPKEISGNIVKSDTLLQDGQETLVYGSISAEGYIVAVDDSQKLHSRSIKPSPANDAVALLPTALHPITAAPLVLPSPGSPAVLLATSHPNPSIILATTTPSLTAVLSVTPIGAVLSPSASISSLSLLSHAASGHFVVAATLTYTADEAVGTAGTGRSVVYTVEVNLPERGIGLNLLLGTHALTSTYFQTSSSAKASDQSTEELLQVIQQTLSASDGASAERLSEVENLYKAWFKDQEKRHNAINPKKRQSSAFPPETVKRLLKQIFDLALESSTNSQGVESKKPTGRYARSIVKDLITRKMVHDGMYEGGVITSALLPLADWSNIVLAIQNVPSIPSSALAQILSASIHVSHTVTGVPALSTLLQAILALPPPPPDYRGALRRYLTVEDATKLLTVYAGWLDVHVEQKGAGLEGWLEDDKVAKPQQGGKESSATPSLESVICHTSAILDSHLPLFLSYKHSFTPLERVQESLYPLIALQESYRKLRAPVEAILTLSKREARKREERENKKAAMSGNRANDPDTAWIQKKNNAAAVAQGKKPTVKSKPQAEQSATLPEEVVGKWRVEDLAF